MQLCSARLAVVAVVAVGLLAACAPTESEPPSTVPSTVPSTGVTTTALTTTVPATTVPMTTVPMTTVPMTTVPMTTVPATTALSTTVPATTVPVDLATRVIGTSVQGRDITAVQRGTAGGRVVLVIGVIHGDEDDGLAIMERLHESVVPPGIELWLVDSMNPDGVVAGTRQNANAVDLNRNFPDDWGPIGAPGDSQYAGPSAASEPETQAVVSFVGAIQPDLVIWYHQDLFRIAPSDGRSGAIKARYAELTGLPLVSITGGTYTGVAATWARHTIDPGVAFIVELGPSVSAEEADIHAAAVLTVASEPN